MPEQPKIYIAKETSDTIYTCPVCRMPHMKKDVTPVICPCCGTRLYYDINEWIENSKISAEEIENLILSAADGMDALFGEEIQSQGYDTQYTDYIREALAKKKQNQKE